MQRLSKQAKTTTSFEHIFTMILASVNLPNKANQFAAIRCRIRFALRCLRRYLPRD